MTHHVHKNRRTESGAFHFGPKSHMGFEEHINTLIDAALEDEVALQRPRGYLGGSRLGLPCGRQLAYEYFKGREDKAAYDLSWKAFMSLRDVPLDSFQHRTPHSFPGKIIRRFSMGHWHEDETARWLRLAGFEIQTEQPDGKQFGFAVAPDPETGEPRLSGHGDGIIVSGPVALAYPLLWEHKIMKHSKWMETNKKGVEAVYPVYFYQMQTYMAYFELRAALFQAVDTDTSELLSQVIELDLEKAQWATDRGVKVIEAKVPEELPRIATVETDFRCRFCDFKETCWDHPGKAGMTIARPDWLTKGETTK